MAHSHTSTLYHVIYSTKHRQPLLTPPILTRLIEFTGGLIRQSGGRMLAMGGSPDHVHVLASLTPSAAISSQIREIKSLSSGWLKSSFPQLRAFAWQEGYSAVSVSQSVAGAVERYVRAQAEHHQTRTFEEELVAILQKAGIEFDPRFVLD